MGFSFHDKPSLVEAVSDLRFEVADWNPIPGLGSISLDRSLCTGSHDPNIKCCVRTEVGKSEMSQR
jgi:hypothetical protein